MSEFLKRSTPLPDVPDPYAPFWWLLVFLAVFLLVIGGPLLVWHLRRGEDVAEFPIVDLSSDGEKDEKQDWITATSAEVQASPWTYVGAALDGKTTLVVRSDNGDPLCFITPHKENQ